jgi:hypothetical protein
MTKVVSDILMALDHGDIATLALLDCLAAFDTVDPDILLRKLSESFGVNGTALLRLTSYLCSRQQCFPYDGCQSSYELLNYGDPKDQSLGRSYSSSILRKSARW